MTNKVATNVANASSIYFHSKKVTDCNILHSVLLAIILLLIITIICYHYAKQNSTMKVKKNQKYALEI